jgi:hypothetical protein
VRYFDLQMDVVKPRARFAAQGWLGLFLLGVCWPLNWTLPGLRTAYLFFPLWLGYILVVDGLVLRRTGNSLWTRQRCGFLLLFLLSAPSWWLFEFINRRTGNWEYLGAGHFTPLEYHLLCSLSFSTVMPAVFETAELVRTFRWVQSLQPGPKVPDTTRLAWGQFLAGLAMLALTLVWPQRFYSLTWVALFFILEPMNRALGRRRLLPQLQHGNWRPVVSLSVGALICGFFWEMWNYWSWPRWIYHTPGVEYCHIFEMPMLGYGGYLPFALELFALMNFLWPRPPELRL